MESAKIMLSQKKKQGIINKFKTHETDTGSAEVQIAILTEEIKELTKHLQSHKHDHSSRRGLLKKVGERRRLIRYLEIDNPESFAKLIQELKLKPTSRMKRDQEIQKLLEEEIATVAAESEAEEAEKNQEEKINENE